MNKGIVFILLLASLYVPGVLNAQSLEFAGHYNEILEAPGNIMIDRGIFLELSSGHYQGYFYSAQVDGTDQQKNPLDNLVINASSGTIVFDKAGERFEGVFSIECDNYHRINITSAANTFSFQNSACRK